MSPSHRRASRAFRPSSFGPVQLESRRLLDAAGIAAEVAAIADTKAQYKADLAEWKIDKIIYQNDFIIWQNDRNDMSTRIFILDGDIDKFNADFRPKRISFKETNEFNIATNKFEPKVSLEIDLGALLVGLKRDAANTQRTDLLARSAGLDADAKALNVRKGPLAAEDKALGDRKAVLDQRKAALNMAETNVQMEEYFSGLAMTTFDDSDIAEELVLPDYPGTVDMMTVLDYKDEEIDNSMYEMYA